MTETDVTKQPIRMPEYFIPYLERGRIYQLFKDMVSDLLVCMPSDHLRHMKAFLINQTKGARDSYNIMVLVSPDVVLDKKMLVTEIVKCLGLAVITRDVVMDYYTKQDEYVRGCIIPEMMAKVTKIIALQEPVPQTGWIMMDHPCTLREARCLSAAGVLPTVTLMLLPPPTAESVVTPKPPVPLAVPRGFNEQDIDGLRATYEATLKEVIVSPGDSLEKTLSSCFNAIRACVAGSQGPGQAFHSNGSLGVYRILILGPRASGRRTQARLIAKMFNLIHLDFNELFNEALIRKDKLAEKIKKYGPNKDSIYEIIDRRILAKDCLDYGWIMTGYPKFAPGMPVDIMESAKTPPNRVIFFKLSKEECIARLEKRKIDWCTGEYATDDNLRAKLHPQDEKHLVESQLECYFTEALDDLRTLAGLNAILVDASLPIEDVNVQVQAAVMAAPIYDAED